MGRDDAGLGNRCNSWATICSSPTRAPITRHRPEVANSILVKVNQIGTLTETSERWSSRIEPLHGRHVHRSGESEDVAIADLAVATDAGRSNRRTVPRRSRGEVQPAARIEEELGSKAIYAGKKAFRVRLAR